jgi:NAD(P)-dependent dehydrogenase (short-subunit alcohol dehydrogenase family)
MPTALITGANRGLGLEFARQLAASDWEVTATCRDPAKAAALRDIALQPGSRVRLEPMDITDPASVRAAAERLVDQPFDLLLNNAGVMSTRGAQFTGSNRRTYQQVGQWDFDEWSEVLRANVIGTALVTQTFLGNVIASRRKLIVMMSSVMGSITLSDRSRFPPGGGIYLYRTSKAALNMLARSLACDLHPQGITVLTLNPGWVRTDMGGKEALFEAPDAVRKLVAIIDSASIESSGRFVSFDGSEIPW